MGTTIAWLVSIREDVGLLMHEFLPEILLISILLLVSWGLRKRWGRNARSTF